MGLRNRLIGLITVACLSFPASSQNQPGLPPETAAQILALSSTEADHHYPVSIRGVVTEAVEQGLILHDSTAGVWVYWERSEDCQPGDELDVHGVTAKGMFTPVLNADSVHKIGHAALPTPVKATLAQLNSGDLDGQYVTVTGSVRSVRVQEAVPHSKRLSLKLKVDGGFLTVTLPKDNEKVPQSLVDAVVRLTGTAMCSKNDSRQIIAPVLALSGLQDIHIVKASQQLPFSLPTLPIGKLMQYRSGSSYDRRVHVSGTVTYYQPGASLILEDHGSALFVKTTQSSKLELGDRVEVVGFPAPQNSGPILEDALLKRVASGPRLKPALVRLDDVCSGTLNYNLVSSEGRLLRQIREPSRDVFLLQDRSGIILAETATPVTPVNIPTLPEGSIVSVAGISALQVGDAWNYGVDSTKAVRCTLLLRSTADVQIVQPPSWWTTRHVFYIALGLGLLALAFLVQVVRSRIERWRLHAVMAERERLAHEIHDTLAQSFAGIGFQLQAIAKSIPETLPNLRQQVTLATELVRHSHKEARRSIEPLHLDPKEEIDLFPALKQSAAQMLDGGAVKLMASCSGESRSIPAPVAAVLLRIGQEAIANAVRHANASCLEIALAYTRDAVTLSVQDDGVGFVKSGNLLGFGLRGMRKHAASLSATLDIASQPGNGTRITVVAPLPPFSARHAIRSIWSTVWSTVFHAYTSH